MSKAKYQYVWVYLLVWSVLSCASLFSVTHAQDSTLERAGTGQIAPGGTLPIQVKLTNFGSERRVDVEITYRVLDVSGAVVVSESETVAVDTSASFVKQFRLPPTIPPGVYRAESTIHYPYQAVPAVSGFVFTVERTYFGIFWSDFLRYGGLALVAAILTLILGRLLIRSRKRRVVLHEYGDVSKDKRIYYEILSDTIGQMRLRAGDQALEVALGVPGLSVDERTGRVLSITDSPAKVVAALVSGYEKALGQKVSFTLRKEK